MLKLLSAYACNMYYSDIGSQSREECSILDWIAGHVEGIRHLLVKPPYVGTFVLVDCVPIVIASIVGTDRFLGWSG